MPSYMHFCQRWLVLCGWVCSVLCYFVFSPLHIYLLRLTVKTVYNFKSDKMEKGKTYKSTDEVFSFELLSSLQHENSSIIPVITFNNCWAKIRF